MLLTHGTRTGWWQDGLSSLNTRLVMRICKNKDVTTALLDARDIPVFRNQVFAAGEAGRAWTWGVRFGRLVLKPADSTGGTGVHVGIADRQTFIAAFDSIAGEYDRVLVEEFGEGTEYRFLLVAARVVAVVERRPTSVVGDGWRTVGSLLRRKNSSRWQAPSHKQLRRTQIEEEHLSAQGYGWHTRPKKGQQVFLRSTSNLHTGGDAVDVTDRIAPEHVDMVERAARALRGGRLLGVDVLIPPEGHQGARIVEVNSGPMISMHHLPWEGSPRNVARAVVEAMFPALRTDFTISDLVEPHEVSARAARDVKRPANRFHRRLARMRNKRADG